MMTPSSLQHYAENGFVVVDHAFSQENLSAFSDALDRICRYQWRLACQSKNLSDNVSFHREFDAGMMMLENADHAYVASISDMLSGMPEVSRLLSGERLLSQIRDLMSGDQGSPLFCTNGSAILAMPHDTKFTHSWHKDTFYTLPRSSYIQIWAPLVRDSTVELGTLKVCPGSHKAGWKGQTRVDNARNIHKFKITDEELSKYRQVDIELKLGQAVLFHSGLAHSGGRNSSAVCRFSLVGVYHCVECTEFSARPRMSADQYYDELYGNAEI
jgi:ectoine hydroxylase-related dioxygenase (phytanoyl-CoA dioxygenase family)